MALAENLKIAADEYLAGEMQAELKHELIGGEVYAMAGASRNHNIITLNAAFEFKAQLKGKPCIPFSSDMKVHADGDYYYPDISVVCENDKRDTDYVIHAPSVIVEVLSRTTRKLDHGTKLNNYQKLPSLQYYLLVEQDICEVSLYSRANGWVPEFFYLGDSIELPAIGVVLSVTDIYDRIENEDVEAYLAILEANKEN